MVWPVVAVRGPSDVDVATRQRQRGALGLPQGVEAQGGAVAARAGAEHGDRCRVRVAAVRAADGGVADRHHAVHGPVQAGLDVEGVQPLHIVRDAANDFLGFGDDVHRVRGGVDHRRAGDADLGHDVAGDDVGLGDRGDAAGRVDEGALPELAAAVAVEGVDAVVLCGSVHHVVHAAVDSQVGHVQGLRVSVAVDGVVNEVAEIGRVDVGGSEGRLLIIPTGKQGVVVAAEDRHVGRRQAGFEGFHDQPRLAADGQAANARGPAAQRGEVPLHRRLTPSWWAPTDASRGAPRRGAPPQAIPGKRGKGS